ncbi:hypothetical protein [Sulfuriflexus sp.]|uniref:hypothetical protein n=1 Tax=Sulfuriflexus sp. TaxID=2015443 RepID=UPI0028CDE838|nr:hypothetical protein [Sulfuriflexus sp.]MDT8404314.1 hypothetical protein [Sulfuriflexus sp.]
MASLIRIECPPPLQAILCEAIREYAAAAYPPGGSECGQVAHAALMEAALKLETDFAANDGEYAGLNRRLRAQFRAAFQYYAEQHQRRELEPLLLRLLQGEVVSHAEWAASVS